MQSFFECLMSGPLLADKRPCLFCAGTSTRVSKCVVNEWGTANGNIGKSGVEAEAGSWMKLSRAYQTHANTIEVTAAVHPNGCQLMLSELDWPKSFPLACRPHKCLWSCHISKDFAVALYAPWIHWPIGHVNTLPYPQLFVLMRFRFHTVKCMPLPLMCFAYRFELYIIYSIDSGPCHPKCLTLCGAYLFCSKINSRTIKRGQSKQAKNRRTGVAVALHAIVADWLQEEQR